MGRAGIGTAAGCGYDAEEWRCYVSKIILRPHAEAEMECAAQDQARQYDAWCIGCIYRHDGAGCSAADPCGDECVLDYEEVKT